jgi:phosphoglycerol transferase MdoB-like AlkP superfamily enzyme
MKSPSDIFNKNLAKLFIQSFVAVCGLILLLMIYHFVIFRLEGGNLQQPLSTLRIILAFMQKHNEMEFALCFAGCSFVLINLVPKIIRGILYMIFIVIVIFWVLYRILNIIHLYYAGSHLGRVFLSHIEISSISMIFNIKAIMILVIILFPVLFLLYFLLKIKLDYSSFSFPIRISVFLSLALIFSIALFIGDTDLKSFNVQMLLSDFKFNYPLTSQVPERFLLSSFIKDAAAHAGHDTRVNISPSTNEKIKTLFGIYIDNNKKLPLYKQHIYLDKFPYARLNHITPTPNIVIFAMESLSSRFLGYYGAPSPEISPNIDRFAHESMVVRPVYNASTPTIQGLVSLLCSHYPVYGHGDWFENNGSMNFDLLCLPEILKKKGYHTYNITPGDPYYTAQLPFMKANGMDIVDGAPTIRKVLQEEPKGSLFKGYTFSDHQVIGFLTERLKNNFYQEPFVMLISTNDFHPPFELPKDCIRYPQDNNPILHLVHNADAAFGTFLRYFESSSYAKKTILVLTADHALLPGVTYKRLFRDQNIGYYDEIPLIIYDPTHRLPQKLDITSSAVDVTPSLLHLLNIDMPNPFEGMSVFDRWGRTRHQNILGSHHDFLFYRLRGRNFSFNRDDLACDDHLEDSVRTEGKEVFTACDYYEWLQYKTWLVKDNRIWKD